MPASLGPGCLLFAALLSTNSAFSHALHLQPSRAAQLIDRRSVYGSYGGSVLLHDAALEKRSAKPVAATANIAALMDHGWHGGDFEKPASDASAKPSSDQKSKAKQDSKSKATAKPNQPITVEVVKEMAKTRWQKDANHQQTISRLYHDLPGRGKMGSGTGATDRLTFEFMADLHYNFGKEPQNAWRFLERGAKAKAGFGHVHYKAWEAAFTLIKSDFPQVLSRANINKCMMQAKEKHEGVFGENFKAGSYH